MKLRAIRTIEMLRKIEIPQQLRNELKWQPDNVIEFYTMDRAIILRLSKEGLKLQRNVCYKDKYGPAEKCNFCGRCR